MTDNGQNIADDEDLWGQLLGNRLDRIPEDERSIEQLVQRFADNKIEIVRFYHDSTANLLQKVREAEYEEAEDILLLLWAEHEWRNKRSGTEFELEGNLADELNKLEEQGNLVQQLNPDFALVWTAKEKRRVLKEQDGIHSEVQTEAKPVFIRSSNTDNTVEVRGPARLLDNFSEEFSESQEVEKVEPEPTDEPVLDKLSTAFETDLSSLTLVGAKFNSTNLPDSSSLALSNPEGINRDLNESSLDGEFIDKDNLSDLDYLKFVHNKEGIKIKVSLEQVNEGFHFSIDDSNLPEDEKVNVREILERKVGISFDSLYPYDSQHHESYIVNQILTGNKKVYRQYYDGLEPRAQNFVDDVVNVSGQDILLCYTCDQPYYESEVDGQCPKCGNTLWRGDRSVTIEIDEGEILDRVSETLQGFPEDITGSQGTRLMGTTFGGTEIANNVYIKSNFHLAESAGSAMSSHWYEFFIHCLGNGDLPQRVNEYLLDCVLVTYGSSQIRGRDNFGAINLYELLEGENPEQAFVKAVRQSRSKLRNRIRKQSTDAYERLTELQSKVDNGTIEVASRVDKAELKSEYDYEDFERDVFYLFKSMFSFTERWGREGKKETDGCLIIPDSNDDYFLATYDPKLTYDIDGYDLNAEEKNKAAYYILSESNHDYISDVLKSGESIDAHIFVSDIFKEGQFEHVVDTVHDWFTLVKSEKGDIDIPVIFLTLESLLDLYDIFDSHYHFIIEYRDVQQAFREGIQNQLSTRDNYRAFDEESIHEIRKKVLEAKSSASKKKPVKSYTDS